MKLNAPSLAPAPGTASAAAPGERQAAAGQARRNDATASRRGPLRRRRSSPWAPTAAERRSLAEPLLLAALLHPLPVLLIGNAPGGSARPGSGVGGPMSVTLRGYDRPPREPPSEAWPALTRVEPPAAPERAPPAAVAAPERAPPPVAPPAPAPDSAMPLPLPLPPPTPLAAPPAPRVEAPAWACWRRCRSRPTPSPGRAAAGRAQATYHGPRGRFVRAPSRPHA